jgi:molybdate transport system substrate-binding protein
MIFFRIITGLLLCLSSAHAASAQDLTVFAAASLKEALDEQIAAFDRQTGSKTVVSYAGSNVLAKQIENGAPADVFISADTDWMDYLQSRKLIAPASRKNLLGNQLVLVSPAQNNQKLALPAAPPGEKDAAALAASLLRAVADSRLAIANPDAVPAGKYAKSSLQALGVWASIEPKIARTENVRTALTLVARGEAALGIVYRTDALAEPRVRVVDAFAAGLHPAIVYPAAATAASQKPQAKALLDYLASSAARTRWQARGFSMPSSAP